MGKKIFFLALFFYVLSFCVFPAKASLVVCQKDSCKSIVHNSEFQLLIKKLFSYFKTPNMRIDFCESNAQNHKCLSDGLQWQAQSALYPVYFSTRVARTLPYKNSLLLDYLISANEFLPNCSFAGTTFNKIDGNSLRMVSHEFECQIADYAKTKIQNTFFIDYVNFDRGVIGAKYTIQTSGQIKGKSSGYTLMTFRDGETLRPITTYPKVDDMPDPPTYEETKQLSILANMDEDFQIRARWNKFKTGVSDWWQALKESLNMGDASDSKKHASTQTKKPHWWHNFTDKFMKILYLEPLD